MERLLTSGMGRGSDVQCRAGTGQSRRRRRATTACLLLLVAAVACTSEAQPLPGDEEATLRVTAALRSTCPVSYKCGNFFFSRTPYSVSNVRYDAATSRLCYSVSASAGCGPKCTSKSCGATTGVASIYMVAPDIGVRPALASGSNIGGRAGVRVSPPKCVQKVGIATELKSQAAGGLLVAKGAGAKSVCLQYPRGTAFRRIGRLVGGGARPPATCCTTASAYKPLYTSLTVWARGGGKVFGTGAGCQACSNVKAAVSAGAIVGTVWQDSNGDNSFTAGVDEGFEGVTVNLWRLAGSSRTFMGCTSTNGAGAYKFSRVVADRYAVQVVPPPAGSSAVMRFARRGSGLRASDLQASGYSSTLTITSATVTVNALIQIIPISGARR